MAATITACNQIGSGAWRYEWTGTAPFTAYCQGVAVVENSDATEFVAQWDDDEEHTEPPPLEVIDSTQTAAGLSQTLYPPIVTLQFRGADTNSYYIVERYTGSEWVEIATIVEDGSGYYQYRSPFWLTGDQDVRLTPYDESGTAGIPMTFSLFHHTAPFRELTYTYNAGTGDLTVAA